MVPKRPIDHNLSFDFLDRSSSKFPKTSSQPDLATPLPGSVKVRKEQKPEQNLDPGAPCGPKPALDPLALKSTQNTPRKREPMFDQPEKSNSVSSIGHFGAKIAANVPIFSEKKLEGLSFKLSNNPSGSKPVSSSSTPSLKDAPTFASGLNHASLIQTKKQDLSRSNSICKTQSTEEVQDSENSSEGNEGFRSCCPTSDSLN